MAGFVYQENAERWTTTLQMIATGDWLSAVSISQPIDGKHEKSCALNVDLSATDAVLIEAFKLWLKEVREQTTTHKRERPAYLSWARYGLLPYLDLSIWMKLTNKSIPHELMARAVGYPNGGDSWRKTVPKIREDLAQVLAELEALATIEADMEKPPA